jgi:magnesium transporter
MQILLDRAKREPKRTFGRGATFLAHDILDVAVDQFLAMVDRYEEEVESAEDHLQEPNAGELLGKVLNLKRRVLNLRRQMTAHREIIQRLMRGNHPVVAVESQPYFRDVLDHLQQIEADLDVCRVTIDNARDVCLALANLRTNEIIRVLTVLFTLSLPATVLTGWYGMNFDVLPLAHHPYGAYIFSGILLAVAFVLYLWLRAKKWF